MITKSKFTISSFECNQDLETNVRLEHSNFLNWPLVYFLKDDKKREAYIGETTDVITRLKTHSKTERKQSLSRVNIILSELFNKSATLDLESNLIRYVSADGNYTLQNGNLGISNHRYYNQKEVYWDLFKDIWDELRSIGIARHSLEYIDNSDLFKYSPYKSLSREQVSSLKLILKCLADDNARISIIKGGAGTGKSILAIFLFKLLKTDLNNFNYADFDEEDVELFELLKTVRYKYGELNIALVIPMSSFRQTISKVFKNIEGLSQDLVIGPSDINKKQYDLLIIDEGHRLRRRKNLTNYKSYDDALKRSGLNPEECDEIDLLLEVGSKAVIFYDNAQSVKPTDIPKSKFDLLSSLSSTREEHLFTQYRVKGGNDYVNFINNLFIPNQLDSKKYLFKEYELQMFNDFQTFVNEIKKKENIFGLSRFVAGYAWEHKSKKDPNAIDIVIDDIPFQWNRTSIDWVNSKNAINEIGCIHTTQGYDLNYTGVIIGSEIDYDFDNNEIIIYKERYRDTNGKNSIHDVNILKDYIVNIYKTILLRGIRGTYIYVCNENLRKYLAQFIPLHQENKNSLNFIEMPSSTSIPVYDLSVTAGLFSEVQTTGIRNYIELDEINSPSEYFACKVVGESMNKIIPNGSICLFKKYSGGSKNGLITIVESQEFVDSEFGFHYTIKEYMNKKALDEDGFQYEELQLLPKSYDEVYKPIVLKEHELKNLKVIGTFVRVIE